MFNTVVGSAEVSESFWKWLTSSLEDVCASCPSNCVDVQKEIVQGDVYVCAHSTLILWNYIFKYFYYSGIYRITNNYVVIAVTFVDLNYLGISITLVELLYQDDEHNQYTHLAMDCLKYLMLSESDVM